MERVTVSPSSPPAGETARCFPPRIYVEGSRRRDLKLTGWEVLPAPEFARVRVVLDPTRIDGRTLRLEDAISLPAAGEMLRIVPDERSGGLPLDCVVTRHIGEVTEDAETLSAEAVHQLTPLMQPLISTLWRLDEDGQPIQSDSGPDVWFNAGADSLASAGTFSIHGGACRLFDHSDSARRWTVADALVYLIATTLPEDVQTQTAEELTDLAGAFDLGAVNVGQLSVGEALIHVASVAGLELRATREGRGLIFYRPGQDGPVRTVRLQPGGEALDTGRTNLWEGEITFERRPARPAVLAVGDYKYYESTFELSAGWNPSDETSRWRDFVRSLSDDWTTVAGVYRKWVLNESGRYSGPPWSLPRHDFSAISSSDFFLPVPRIFHSCLSTDPNGSSLGHVVEVSVDGTNWRRWNGTVWVARSECAVYFGNDALDGDFFRAAVAGSARVRITATVASDARISAEQSGDPGAGREILNLSRRARWQSVASGSIFHDADDLGAPEVRDDTQLLTGAARRRQEALTRSVTARLKLGWVDTSFHVGDLIERVQGRAVELASNPDTTARITSVRHDFGPDYTTELTING